MSHAWEWCAVAFYSNARLFVSWFLLRSLIKVIDSIDSYVSEGKVLFGYSAAIQHEYIHTVSQWRP